MNKKKYTDPAYKFKTFNTIHRCIACETIRKNEELDWKMNENLRQSILQDMPYNLTLEEKAMYIYCKMCNIFSFDEKNIYQDYIYENPSKDKTFTQEYLEAIQPNSPINCWNFSKIFSKLVNELNGNIEAVIIRDVTHGSQHHLMGFYTDEISVILEPINGIFNDLTRAKNGIQLEGVEIVSDPKELAKKALDKVYPQIYGKQQISMIKYMERLKKFSKHCENNSFEVKLQTFINIMNKKNISGNEAIQTFNLFNHFHFFGQEYNKAFLGYIGPNKNPEDFKRMVLLREKFNSSTINHSQSAPLYLIWTTPLELTTCQPQEILEKLNSDHLIYENNSHKIPGINKTVNKNDFENER